MPLATYDDARAEFARNAGHDNPDHEWILTPFDTWERNPAYCGPKGRHPEDAYDENGVHYAERAEDIPTPEDFDLLFGTAEEYSASLAAGLARHRAEDFHSDIGGPDFDDYDLPF